MNLASINKAKIFTDGMIIRGANTETPFKIFKFGVKDINAVQTQRSKTLPNGNIKRQYISYLGDGSLSLQTKLYGKDYKLKYQSVGTRNAQGDTISFATKNEKDGIYYQEGVNAKTAEEKSDLEKKLWEKALVHVKNIGLNVL